MRKLKTITRNGTRLEKLKRLALMLAEKLEECSDKEVAQLAKQYRETIYEIENIEGTNDTNDELSEILQNRKADGKPGAVRPDRSKFN